jgi:two-component system sensor histidine kinase QseC
MTSIRCRLLIILIGMFILAWLTVVLATYAVAKHRIETLFDVHLEHDARVLLALADHELQEEGAEPGMVRRVSVDFGQYGKVLAFQVWKDNQIILHSERAPAFEFPGAPGYRNATLKNEAWRLLAVSGPNNRLWVQVGEPYPVRSQLVYEIVRDALYPLLLGVPILAATVWVGVGRGLRPLYEVAGQVAQRSPSHLYPLNLKRVPTEINVLTEKLNELLFLLQDAFERERQFTADAAHEIRTPLAAIKTHAQLALASANDHQRTRALQQIVGGVDRASHLVEQLLILARLDRESLRDEFTEVDLVAVAGQVMADLAGASQSRQIHLGLAAGSRGTVKGSAAALKIMIGNLVDNGIRYSSPGGIVELEVKDREGVTELTVTDNGPGIRANDRLRVFNRFYRGHAQQSPGCGLGLSIVKRIADLHAARIELGDSPGGHGLRVRIRFLNGAEKPFYTAYSADATAPCVLTRR